jgi:hypothetical protein
MILHNDLGPGVRTVNPEPPPTVASSGIAVRRGMNFGSLISPKRYVIADLFPCFRWEGAG